VWCGGVAMMSVADWRKRAIDCKEAARLAPDQDGQTGWRALSDAWLLSAEWRDRERLSGNRDEMQLVVPALPVTSYPDRTSAADSGERLRSLLAL
jgi:hypothetical protein